MKSEVFRMKDFAKTTQAWWYAWHGNPINERLLSRFGVVIHDDKAPIAIAYIYPVQTADMAWIGFTVRDPFASSYKAGKALKLLIPACEDAIKKLGYSIVYTSYDAPALQRLVAERGYFAGSLVQEYFKEI
jgi:hypothetical protein